MFRFVSLMQLTMPYNRGEPNFKIFATKFKGKKIFGKGSVMTSNCIGIHNPYSLQEIA